MTLTINVIQSCLVDNEAYAILPFKKSVEANLYICIVSFFVRVDDEELLYSSCFFPTYTFYGLTLVNYILFNSYICQKILSLQEI